jgi:hypothetical protein
MIDWRRDEEGSTGRSYGAVLAQTRASYQPTPSPTPLVGVHIQ